MTIRLYVLGGFRAFSAGGELNELASQRVRAAILTCIAVERRIARDSLASTIWPDTDTKNARQSLRQNLFTLRQALGVEWLESSPLELRATGHLWCDAHELDTAATFNDYDVAADLYLGPFLGNVHLINSRPWEAWVDRHRAQLARTFRRICRSRVDAMEQAGDLDGAIAAARRWLEPDLVDDEAQHRLLAALGRAGRRTEALREYDRYLAALQGEDLEPLPETSQLIAEIKRTAAMEQPVQHELRSRLPIPTLVPGDGADETSRPEIQHRSQAFGRGHDSPGIHERHDRLGTAPFRKAVAVMVGGLALVAFAALAIHNGRPNLRSIVGVGSTDSLTYALFPISGDTFGLGIHLAEALGAWKSLRVVRIDDHEARQQSTRNASPPPEYERLARAAGAGRFITVDLLNLRDSLGLRAQVWDTHLLRARMEGVAWIQPERQDLAVPIAMLVEDLLLGVRPVRRFAIERPRSTVRSARLAFEAALDSIQDWNLAGADSLLAFAISEDRQMADAYMWLALVRAWNSRERSTWNGAATLAHDGMATLAPLSQKMTQAIYHYSRQLTEQACNLWVSLAREFPADPTVWYGMGHCLLNDSIVVPDRRSPSGFRFRSSHHSAVQAYQEAFMRMPTVHRALRVRGYESVRRILRTDRTFRKEGRSADGTRFFATAFWADSLVFYPIPYDSAMTMPAWLTIAGVNRAIQHQRQIFREIASSWANEFPRSPFALAALATAQEMNADANAIQTMQRARLEASTGADRIELAASDLWLRIRFAMQADASDMEAALLLADSILEDPDIVALDPAIAAAIAGVTGRGEEAVKFARRASHLVPSLPPLVRAPAMEFLARAAAGGPRQELRASEERLIRAIAMSEPPLEAADRNAFLGRGRTLAFHEIIHDSIDSDSDPLLEAQLAAAIGAKDRAFAILARIHRQRSNIHPADIALDALVPEARLLIHMGDLHAALRLLTPTLDQLVLAPPRKLETVAAAASLSHAMALRASLESRVGNPATATVWARRVLTLWRHADPFLQPLIRDLTRISSQ